jgi:predicted amidohydrolase YtcJ
MLISNAECLQLDPSGSIIWQLQDVRITAGLVASLGDLTALPSETVVDAAGACLIPGLHDHHVHLASYAASLGSVPCGPPDVLSEQDLAEQLHTAHFNNTGKNHWLRGVHYHESVAGDIDRQWLDNHGPNRPVRIQHRSGRLWVLNTLALGIIRTVVADTSPLLATDGRLFDVDTTLGQALREALKKSNKDQPLELTPIEVASSKLASFGVTGINDMTPSNDSATFGWLSGLQTHGALKQKVRLSGTHDLIAAKNQANHRLTIGEYKIHLHDSELPEYESLCQNIRQSHESNRPVAIHCVTETALVFALAALRDAGSHAGDRIEHGSVIPPQLLPQLQAAKVSVITQPNFVLERGDAYIKDIPDQEHVWLYRTRSLQQHAIPLAFGTDLPFGHPDPWRAIKAATTRQTHNGAILGKDEILSPESALRGFLGALDNPIATRTISVGEPADLCLMGRAWPEIRMTLSSSDVKLTIVDGDIIYQQP